MPFILMRRTDIPNGVLQVDDLKPNDSQRNYTLEPPGQSGYVRNIPAVVDVVTTGAGPILLLRDACGLAAYLIDNVEDSSGTALTAAVANAAAASIVMKVQSGMAMDLAAVNDSLTNNGVADATAGTGLTAGNSTGSLADVLSILSGAKYDLPAGSEVEDVGNNFNTTPQGFFADTPSVKSLQATGAFYVSNGAGDLFNYKRADFEYNGVLGPAVLVLDDDGTVL